MKIGHTKCLLLNIDYSPLCLMSWKRAVVWSIKYDNNNRYGIEIIDFYKDDYILTAGNKHYPIPAVAKTNRFFKTNLSQITFARKNIFVRDEYSCQYCGKKFEHAKLTYDHVIPRSQGGQTNWTNIVTACVSCNSRKGNRTPKEAGMPLLKIPAKPEKRLRYLPIYDYLTTIKEVPQEWKLYLPEY